MNANDTPTSMREKIGIALFVFGGPILAETYWQHRGDWEWLGQFSPVGIALVSAVAGAIGCFLVAEKPATRLIGLATGALAGFGCTYAFDLVYGGASRAGKERFFVFVGGALPGLLLGLALVWLADKRAKQKTAAAGAPPPAV
jgi:hypothetical protein